MADIIVASISLKDRTVGYYNLKTGEKIPIIRNLKSKSDINAIIEARSIVLCESIYPSDLNSSQVSLVIVVPDDYRYGQRLTLYNFCKTQFDISWHRIISETRALALSAEPQEDRGAICFSYNNKSRILAYCCAEIDDDVYQIKSTSFIKKDDEDIKSVFIDKIRQSLRSVLRLDLYSEAYFSPDVLFMEDIRKHLETIGIVKMRTIAGETLHSNMLRWVSGMLRKTSGAKKLLLDAIPYEIETAHEIAIEKDDPMIISHLEKLTTVMDKQEIADISLVVNYPDQNHSELIGVYSAKINSVKKAETDIIEIETYCDAGGIISVNALMENNGKTYHYHLTGPKQGFGKYEDK